MKAILLAPFENAGLASRMASRLDAEVGQLELRRFPDEETYVRIDADVAGREIIVLACLDRPDSKYLGLVFLAATARDLGATKVGLVCPYLPYMRQDARFRAGEGVTSAYFADALCRAFDWFVTVDPHLHRRRSLDEIYSIPAVAVHAAPLISGWIRRRVSRPLIIGPDAESEQWAASVARDAHAPHVILEKQRTGDYAVEVSIPRTWEWRHHTPVLVDDVISTARTMIAAVKRLRGTGGANPHCVCVHGIFAGTAYEDLAAAGTVHITSCNTVVHKSNEIDVADLLADAVRKLLSGGPS